MSSHRPKSGIPTSAKRDAPSAISLTATRKANPGKADDGSIKPRLLTALVVFLFFAIALFLRVYLPYDQVFTPVGIKFTSNDSYFFMREVDNLVSNFPVHTSIDPYISYPRAAGWTWTSFLVWLIAVPAWIAGLGSPSQHTIDVIGVFMPAILGALTVIPVYFIGKELFGRWAGILSAGLIAILPGEFLGRSILGFTDNHVAEALFTTVTMMFLILAVKSARQAAPGGLTLSHLKNRDWAVIRKPFIYTLLAAISLGIYILTWLGALLFVFISFVFFVAQFIIDHVKHKSTDYLCFVGVIFFFIALLTALLSSSEMLYVVSLVIAVMAILVLNSLTRWMAGKKVSPFYYPATLLGLAVIGGGLLFLVSPSLFKSMLGAFSIFKPSGAQLTTIEMQPLISSLYGNPLAIAWGNFNVSFFLALVSLAILIYIVIKQGSSEKSLLVVWSLIILVATLGQRRFGYYLSVNVALLTGYLSLKFFELGYEWLRVESGPSDRAYRRDRQNTRSVLTTNIIVKSVLTVIIFVAVFAPNVLFPSIRESPAFAVASVTPYAPSNDWVTSMEWLKDNSPEPMGSPEAYYQRFPFPPRGESYRYPESAYGVLAWWDYGYWITRIAHRIPNANPSQDQQSLVNVASFFTAQDEKSAEETRQQLNAPYIVIDHDTSLSKFWAIVTWSGKNLADFFETYYVPQQDNTLRPAILYYPGYYRSMAVRLFNFDGKAVAPESAFVISYRENRDNKTGRAYKVLTSAKQFTSYEEAAAFAASQSSGDFRIVGNNPLKSPVPLEPLEQYRLIHSSDSIIATQEGVKFPAIKIFEYTK